MLGKPNPSLGQPSLHPTADERKPNITADVFISYSPSDEEWVLHELLPRLERSGISYVEQRSFELGRPKLDEMERAVEESLHTLMILSPDYLENTWGHFDSILAGSYGLDIGEWRVIPAVRRKCQVPTRLRALVSIDLEAAGEDTWQRLIDALKPRVVLPYPVGKVDYSLSVPQAVHAKTLIRAHIPDLITPGLTEQQLTTALDSIVGAEATASLVVHSKAAIAAVERGDFNSYVSIGKQIEADAQECPGIVATGRYFAGEGYRLRADLEPDPSKREALINSAIEHYSLALESDPNNPRSLRGLARINQAQQRFDDAILLIERAKGAALMRLSVPLPLSQRLALAHEILRITRHHIDFIVEMQATNPLSAWNREHKKLQLEGYIVESDNLHRENMPLFEGQKRWSQFEWFAGLLFLARAWGHAGDYMRMVQYLGYALWSRRLMLDGSRALTAIERANLQWWLRVASSQPHTSSLAGFCAGVEQLEQALNSGDTQIILQRIDELLLPLIPPWKARPPEATW